jgi:hypothetical protein
MISTVRVDGWLCSCFALCSVACACACVRAQDGINGESRCEAVFIFRSLQRAQDDDNGERSMRTRETETERSHKITKARFE